MKKLIFLLAFVVGCSLLGGCYGIVHDQITYTISPEYFTKFKYHQFGFDPAWFGGHRATVSIIGFLATWWVGTFIGLGLGLVALFFENTQAMRSALGRALAITFSCAAASGAFGFWVGKFFVTHARVQWNVPSDVVDAPSFLVVGSIHNFSYLGGMLGLVAGAVYLLVKRRSLQKAGKTSS